VDIHQREREGVAILDLKGRLTVGPAATQVRDAMSKVTATGQNKIILNLEGVDYIDSTGLGTLVVCYTGTQKAGGALKLLNLNKRNLELLVLTKLSTVFELFNDEQDAVNSFFPNREIKRFDILNFIQGQEEAEQEKKR
jgi:anti-sigma B factor antagonist